MEELKEIDRLKAELQKKEAEHEKEITELNTKHEEELRKLIFIASNAPRENFYELREPNQNSAKYAYDKQLFKDNPDRFNASVECGNEECNEEEREFDLMQGKPCCDLAKEYAQYV